MKSRLVKLAPAALVTLLGFLSTPAPSFGQEEGGGEGAGGESGDGAEGDEAKVDDDADAKWYAIVGGDVYTGTGSVLRGATILSKNGVIDAIGYDLVLPEGTETLDASGYRVYPGLVAMGATNRITQGLFGVGLENPAEEEELDPHFGIDDDPATRSSHVDVGGSPAAEAAQADDSQEDTEKKVEKSEVEDSYDPFSEFMIYALASGITCAEQQNAAVKLKRREIEGIFLREKFLTPISYSLRSPASIRSTKEKFDKAAKYLRELRAWQDKGEKSAKEPSKKGVDTSALKVLEGEVLARFNAGDREELLAIGRLAQTYGFRPVIFGCQEGWTVADELGRAGAFAVITPRDREMKDEVFLRAGGTSIENASKLHRAGVQVAIVPQNASFDLSGLSGRDLFNLPLEAGFAIRGGLSEAAALQAITIVPARLLGVDHRVGTLEVGKDMDAVVCDGDVLHYQTFVQYAVVAGKLQYDKEKEIFFAHIRPRPEKPVLDPGEELTEEPAPPTPDPEEEKEGEEPPKEEEGGEDEEEKKGE